MTYRRKAPVCTDFVSAVCSVWSDPLRVIAQFLCLQDTRSGDDGGSGGIIRLKQGDHTWVGVGTGGTDHLSAVLWVFLDWTRPNCHLLRPG